MALETAKGMKDYLPEEEILRQDIIDSLTEIFKQYGFSPMDTPGIEKYSILSAKYAGGAEILNETFKLTDQGTRKLALRYDLTVPFARVIGMNPKMKMPFKRYQIGKVWRDGPIGHARYREFIQCDVDVVGAKTMDFDAELIFLIDRFFRSQNLSPLIRISNRKILADLMTHLSVPEAKQAPAILSLDKLSKFGKETVQKELAGKGLDASQRDSLFSAMAAKGTNEERLESLERMIPSSEGLREIREILSLCPEISIEFDPSLARGLSYYTGTIIEVFLKESSVTSAVCAGGRYDNLIGDILGRGAFPTVGVSFGLSRIYDAIKTSLPIRRSVTDLYIVPIGTTRQCMELAEHMRDEGIRTEVDLLGRGPSKNMKYANALGIPFVAVIGQDELKKGEARVKDMESGEEKEIALDSLHTVIRPKTVK